jgi:dolichol kinase
LLAGRKKNPEKDRIMPELIPQWQARLVKEMRRKAIHLSGISVPFGILFLGPAATAAAIALALAVSLIIEGQRLKGKIRLPEVRDHEKTRMAGYIYYMAGCLLSLHLFPPMIALTAVLFLSFGDTASGLFGSILKGCDVRGMPAPCTGWRIKPLPVLAATFVICLLIGYLASGFSGLTWPVYLAGAAAATFADGVAVIISGRSLDDNFSIPVFSGALMSAVALISDLMI